MKFRATIEKIWRVWAKALGDKSGKSDKEADTVAMIRTFIFLQLVITNCFIVAGNIRHWNDHYTPPHYEHLRDSPLPSPISDGATRQTCSQNAT